jgi:hypothetical protein
MAEQTLKFEGAVNRMSTDAAGGWKVTLEVPESEAQAMLVLAQLKGLVLSFEVTEA